MPLAEQFIGIPTVNLQTSIPVLSDDEFRLRIPSGPLRLAKEQKELFIICSMFFIQLNRAIFFINIRFSAGSNKTNISDSRY